MGRSKQTIHLHMSKSFTTLIFTTLFFSLMPTPVNADTFFGIYAGYQVWDSRFDGGFNNVSETEIDIENMLGLDQDNTNNFYLALEHPIPFLPNVRVARTTLEVSDSNNLTQPISFQGETFNNTSVSSTIDLGFTDATFYYELLDNWVSLDLGLSLRRFDGSFSISSATQRATMPISETLPLLYGAAQFDLPFTGFYTRVTASSFSLDDHRHTDITAAIGYESSVRFGAELGYRAMDVKFEEVSESAFQLNSDLDVGGIFLGLTLHI